MALTVSAQGASGSSTFFGFNPSCSVNNTNIINCSATDIQLACDFNNNQFISSVVHSYNSTSYSTTRVNQSYFTADVTLPELTETVTIVQNFTDTTVFDTLGLISVFEQGILVSHTCPDCFPNIIQQNTSCSLTDEFNVTYVDLNSCGGTLPANQTLSCDFCTPNFQCTQFDAVCTSTTDILNCLSIEDVNGCFNQTGLASDYNPPPLSSFVSACSLSDFLTNTELLSTFKVNFAVSEYPYAEVGQSIDSTVTITLNGTNVLVDSVQIQFINQTTLYFTENTLDAYYDRSFAFSNAGDYPFIVTGTSNNQTVFTISGQFYAREFVSLDVQLFETRNLTKRYKNELGYIVALPTNDLTDGRTFNDDLMSVVTPFSVTTLGFRKLVGVNESTYYDWGHAPNDRVFYAPYVEGVAQLRLPVQNDTLWELRLFNSDQTGEYIFDSFNYAKVYTLDATGSNDIKLSTVRAPVDAEFKFLVDAWDVRFWEKATKWFILLGLIIIGGLIIYFVGVSSGDPSIAVKTGIALIGAIPTLWLAITFILGFL